MHWDCYTVFSILSGAICIGAGLFARLSARDRLRALLIGVFFAGYGVYVAHQTSGFFIFSVAIFLIPIGAAVLLVLAIASKLTGAGGAGQAAVAGRTDQSPRG
jgi:hypothetical protein